MANPTNQQKAPRNEINGSHRVSTNGSWTIIEKEPLPQDKFSRQLSSQKVFKSATMPLLGKWSTNNTTISNKLSNIYSGQESATNGLSVLGKAWSYFFGKSATPTAKPTISTSRENPAKGDEADMSDPLESFTPDIEVKSKHKKPPFGTSRRWKALRAVLDTGCAAGNWVSLETVHDLGYEKLLELTDSERAGAVTVDGFNLKAYAAVHLTWRGVHGVERDRINCSRNFKMRFLVLPQSCNPAPFQMLIGIHSIVEHRILTAPLLMVGRRTVIVPAANKVLLAQTASSWSERKAANEKAKKELLRSKADAEITKLARPSPGPNITAHEISKVEKIKNTIGTVSQTDGSISDTETLHDKDTDGSKKDKTKKPPGEIESSKLPIQAKSDTLKAKSNTPKAK